MKRQFFIYLSLLFFNFAGAQIHEIGVFLGGNNYIGDIGKTTYVNPNQLAYGVMYKWNRSTRHSWRASYIQGKITGNDSESEAPNRNLRGYSFENTVKELTLGLEFNFFDFNLHELKKQVTPYVFSGLSFTQYKGLFFKNGKTTSDADHGTATIPMIVGVKSNLLPKLILGFEVGARYTFADDLDGSNPTNKSLSQLKFGNINSNDWYMFTGFTLTYTFGNKPCFCPD
jgi:Domain of unknown function (DUF6089)